MRIAFISTLSGYPWGGSEELWYRVALAALENGHEVYVSMPASSRAEPHIQSLIDRGASIGFRKLYLPSNGYLSRASNLAMAKVARRLKFTYADVERFKPEKVVVNLSPTYSLLNLPDLRSFLSETEASYGFISQGHDDDPFTSDEWRLIVRDTFLKAAWIGFVSQANLESAERHLATRLTNAFVVQNPAMLKSNGYVPFPSSIEPLRFANVARFDPTQKGQDLLFEVLGGSEWRSRNWTMSFAGSIHRQEKYFHDLAELYGITDKVNFLGHVSDVGNLWRDHHLLILPSRFEGTPLALIEAMICGRTALVTDVAGNCEWIDSGLGFIAESASPKYLASALEDLWQNRERLEELGKQCRRRALELVDPNMTEKILERLTS